ncbi:hypothetical protein ASG12_10030 [Williamsia sp. Leaf354]|uniref:alpha/beta fold hydrolase n=1 Tax=Williamsia sp. Leaf354 TaxID=1736349 RepID=UPI0006F573C3|nr:alpha/beta hydrolase [Williamsia sp. Leaf354]KQR98716.1 hypothetical protein ASG12_10030 [Williamsia sp. Leaf354]
MPLIEINDTVLHHDDRPADPDAADGRDILLLHSFGTSARVWQPMMPMLGRRHRVVALDARNHGRSATTTACSLDENVADVIELIGALGLVRPLIVGSSIGSLVATTVAHRAPDLVGAVSVVGGAGHAPTVDPDLASAMRAMVSGLRDDPAATIAAVVPGWFGPLVGPRVHDWVAEQIGEMRTEALAIAVDAIAADPRADLAELAVPVHYLHGTLDRIPVDIARESAALSTSATVTVLDGVAHMPHIEMPGWFAGWLADRADKK